MTELVNIGISINTIKEMLELVPSIKDMSEKEILEKIYLLQKLNCEDNQIRNIISSNAFYLDRTNDEVIRLIMTLMSLGFKTLNILFDSNPYILNLDSFEIDNYINLRKSNGEILEDIIDDLESNPYLFNEM